MCEKLERGLSCSESVRSAKFFSFCLPLWPLLNFTAVSPDGLVSVAELHSFPAVHLNPLECHVSRVCADLSVVYACLSKTGQDILQQANTAHIINQAILICYITFYFKASFPREGMHHIQYESKTLKVSLLPTKLRV